MEHLRYAWRIVLPYVGTLPRFLGFAGSTHDVWLHCGIRCSFRHANKLIYIKSIPAKRRRANYIASATVGIMPRFPPVVNFFCQFRRSFPIFHEKDAEFRCGYPTFLPNGGDFPHFKWNEGSCGTPVLWVCCCFSLVLLPKGFAIALGEPSPSLRMKVVRKCSFFFCMTHPVYRMRTEGVQRATGKPSGISMTILLQVVCTLATLFECDSRGLSDRPLKPLRSPSL